MSNKTLNPEELDRYSRQLPVDDWGEEAQTRLKNARVGIAGAGGLGSPVATYLAAAGVGTLVLCDYQEVELSNLNRQVLFESSDVGKSKIARAARRLSALNPHINIILENRQISEINNKEIFGSCNLIIDCLDNWPTRFLLNSLSVEEGIPFLHGGIREHWGQFALLIPGESACLSCFLDPPEETDSEPIPVYGAVAGIVGSMMAAEALIFLGESAPAITGELRLFDALSMSLEKVELERRSDCPVCSRA